MQALCKYLLTGRNSYMQVGESQCTDSKILQAVADTLKEAIGKEYFHLFLDCEVARYSWCTLNANFQFINKYRIFGGVHL